ncbi:phosphatidylinositol 3-kinase regulatory subunit alpha [Plakobranchus ocellatus]|uniref:Phosphatidylinositol 3-kinase regulatory subunit alpha n=1 Tax=Plakobranchus ocellatus TaxID=259542 RepID=A0AAV3YUM7_9GAST|nr:phosphatidylinositol 3-kinase regulatory subunit alpha [Plakobranchus ocellatus]
MSSFRVIGERNVQFRNTTVSGVVTAFADVAPVSEWSVANVLEWMAAANLYEFAETFLERHITGADLLGMDQGKLWVSTTSFLQRGPEPPPPSLACHSARLVVRS